MDDVVRAPFDADGEFRAQRMVRWLGPTGLTTTAMQVALSTIFGAYSDKREIQAALKESASRISPTGRSCGSTSSPTPATGSTPPSRPLVSCGRTWSSPTTASTIRPSAASCWCWAATWPIRRPRRTSYRDRFIGPYDAAFPEPAGRRAARRMIACAGNHDWYDGLTTFLRLFCQRKRIGGWQTRADPQLLHRPPAARLVDHGRSTWPSTSSSTSRRWRSSGGEASERLAPGDKVILVTHRPSWLFHQIGDDQLLHPHVDDQPPAVRATTSSMPTAWSCRWCWPATSTTTTATPPPTAATSASPPERAPPSCIRPTTWHQTFTLARSRGPGHLRAEGRLPGCGHVTTSALGNAAGPVQEPQLHGLRRRPLPAVRPARSASPSPPPPRREGFTAGACREHAVLRRPRSPRACSTTLPASSWPCSAGRDHGDLRRRPHAGRGGRVVGVIHFCAALHPARSSSSV